MILEYEGENMVKTFLYFMRGSWHAGSTYKYYTMLKKLYGGYMIADYITDKRIKDKLGKPDLIFMLHHFRFYDEYKNNYPNIPYVIIENDVDLMRNGVNGHTIEEHRKRIEEAGAIIFTCQSHADFYLKTLKFKLPYYEVIPLRPLKNDIVGYSKDKIGNRELVYIGGIVGEEKNKNFYYRYLIPIFKKFIRAGWNIHIYPIVNTKDILKTYLKIGCIFHEKMAFQDLTSEISQYRAGLHVFNRKNTPIKAYNYCQKCVSNKTWDYLAAGIPTIGYHPGVGGDIYDKKWGIVLKSLGKKQLEQLDDDLKKIKIDKALIYHETMERDTKKFQRIVNHALGEEYSEE
jgi:hypothetical protein